MKLETIKLKSELISELMEVTGKRTPQAAAEFAVLKIIENAPKKKAAESNSEYAGYKFSEKTKRIMGIVSGEGKSKEDFFIDAVKEKNL
jgi:hypothetical protein